MREIFDDIVIRNLPTWNHQIHQPALGNEYVIYI